MGLDEFNMYQDSVGRIIRELKHGYNFTDDIR